MPSLPAYYIGNGLDFSPLDNALGRMAQQQEMAQRRAVEQQRLGMEQERLGFERQMIPGRMSLQEMQIKAAEADAKRAAMMTPMQLAKIQADIAATRAHADLFGAQARAATQKDALDEFILRRFGGGPAPAPAPAAPGPVRPQSMAPGAAPMTPMPMADAGPGMDPNIIRTQAAPQAPAKPATPPGMVDTPMGPMSPAEARQMGFLLALKGKGPAGQMLVDSADPNKLGKEVRNKVDEAEFNATQQLARLKAIRDGFKPEYQTFEGQMKQFGVGIADSFETLRGKLDPATLQKHAEYKAWASDAYDNMNRYIKEITGAAMSEVEAQRIRKAIPDPQNDGPTAFKAKMEAAVKQGQLAIARMRFLRQNGFNGQPWGGTAEDAARMLPLDRMNTMIRADTSKLLQQLKAQNPSVPEDQIRGNVRNIIRARYGLDT